MQTFETNKKRKYVSIINLIESPDGIHAILNIKSDTMCSVANWTEIHKIYRHHLSSYHHIKPIENHFRPSLLILLSKIFP